MFSLNAIIPAPFKFFAWLALADFLTHLTLQNINIIQTFLDVSINIVYFGTALIENRQKQLIIC